MYNPEQPRPPQAQQHMAPPRMSFSSDFMLEPPPPPRPPGRADADFEFSLAGSQPMMDVDQLFSKGRIMPLWEAGRGHRQPCATSCAWRRTPPTVAAAGLHGGRSCWG